VLLGVEGWRFVPPERVLPVFISKVVLDKLISLLYHGESVAVFADRKY
jgi:hypothetical protein